jgi:hypothetical protein
MPLYNVEVTVRYTIVVSADNEDKAEDVARENWGEGLKDADPWPELDIRGEIKTESNLRDGWDENCLPYGGDGKTRIGDILSA